MAIDSVSSGIINQINKTTNTISNLFNQLATGKRVNSAKDDPASLAIGTGLQTSIQSLNAVNQGISTSQGVLSTAAGGLDSTLNSLQQARSLALQASNGTLNDNQRAGLQQQYDQTMQNIDQVSSQTNFNGTNLLDGSFSQSVTTGTDGQSTNVSIGSVSSSALGVSATGISTQASAQDALASIDSAISQVETQQSNIGAAQSSFNFSSSANSIAAENLSAAASTTTDSDLANVTSQLSQQKVLVQAQVLALKAKNDEVKTAGKSLISTM
ncbi:MAG: hypothetical protein JWQ35_1870 [Bacteriovoracaceae bacterium]|nr:hypothetical protein [Bacteriovoracaceae bacterium]